jgi:spore coat polysaccharide biosynthesis predicted glycosyltransferase SpsG
MSVLSAKRLALLRQEKARKTLWVRTAAGPRIGFGHLRRTLILARKLRRLARPLFLLDSKDHWSKEQVTSAGFEHRQFHPQKPWPALEPPTALLIDTRRKAGLDLLVAEARRRRVPVASIHDLGLVPLASDVVIDGSMLSTARVYPRRKARCFTGTPYLALEEACARFNKQPKRIRPRIAKVVVNLGGGNGSKIFRTILKGLRAANSPLDVVGLPGFCSWGQEQLMGIQRNPLRFRWASREVDAVRLMFHADLVISAGGLAAYEALCVGAPLCALACDRHQARTVKAMARAGACLDLGRGALLKSSDVLYRFRELDKNPELRRRISARGRRLVDGEGTRRIARVLRAVIERGSRSPSPPSKAGAGPAVSVDRKCLIR